MTCGAQPVAVGSRDGTSQFLDPLQPAELTGTDAPALGSGPNPLAQKWGQDERYLATTRAIAGQPTVLDAAYNAGEQSVVHYANRIPPYPETREYVKLVQQFYELYRPPLPALPARIHIPSPRNPS